LLNAFERLNTQGGQKTSGQNDVRMAVTHFF